MASSSVVAVSTSSSACGFFFLSFFSTHYPQPVDPVKVTLGLLAMLHRVDSQEEVSHACLSISTICTMTAAWPRHSFFQLQVIPAAMFASVFVADFGIGLLQRGGGGY